MRWLGLLFAALPVTAAADITGASYLEPTDIYGHNAIVGGEYAVLSITAGDADWHIRFDNAVFEDSAPRLVDFDGDGSPEVLTVYSEFEQGARVQILDWVDGAIAPVAANAPIGTRFRWLSIAGATDLDGDGTIEIAYVDRPHLAKILRVLNVTVEDGVWTLTEVATQPGLTNHKYRDPAIEGGIRECGFRPEIITADADWARVIATTLINGTLVSRELGPYTGPQSLSAPLACE